MGRHHRHAALEAQQRHNVLLMLRALLAAYAVPPNCELLSALRLGAAGHPDVWVRPVKAASSAGCWHRLDHTTISFHDSNSFRKLLQQLSDVELYLKRLRYNASTGYPSKGWGARCAK